MFSRTLTYRSISLSYSFRWDIDIRADELPPYLQSVCCIAEQRDPLPCACTGANNTYGMDEIRLETDKIFERVDRSVVAQLRYHWTSQMTKFTYVIRTVRCEECGAEWNVSLVRVG